MTLVLIENIEEKKVQNNPNIWFDCLSPNLAQSLFTVNLSFASDLTEKKLKPLLFDFLDGDHYDKTIHQGKENLVKNLHPTRPKTYRNYFFSKPENLDRSSFHDIRFIEDVLIIQDHLDDFSEIKDYKTRETNFEKSINGIINKFRKFSNLSIPLRL